MGAVGAWGQPRSTWTRVQQSIRLESRRELAEALTEALSMAGDNLRWERSGLVIYDIRDGVASVTDDLDEANVATVQVNLAVDRSDVPALEEQLAFTLWKSADGGWRVTGLDKGLPVLEDFLNELRGFGLTAQHSWNSRSVPKPPDTPVSAI